MLRGPGEKHSIAEGLPGAPCSQEQPGRVAVPLQEGDRQPSPCSWGWADAERVPQAGVPASAGAQQEVSRYLLPLWCLAVTQLPAQPGKLWPQLRAKFAPVLWPSLTEKGDVPRSKGLPLLPLHARGTVRPPLGPAGPLPFLPLIFQPALLLGARLHFQGQLH